MYRINVGLIDYEEKMDKDIAAAQKAQAKLVKANKGKENASKKLNAFGESMEKVDIKPKPKSKPVEATTTDSKTAGLTGFPNWRIHLGYFWLVCAFFTVEILTHLGFNSLQLAFWTTAFAIAFGSAGVGMILIGSFKAVIERLDVIINNQGNK